MKFLCFTVVFLALFSHLHCKDTLSTSKKLVGKSRSNLERALDEFRSASDGINKKLSTIKSDILNYFDQSGTAPFILEISGLTSSIAELQRTILTNKKEISLQKILNINQRYLKMSADWDAYKNTHTTTTSNPLVDVKQDLLDLSDKTISLQFEVLLSSIDPKEKDKLVGSLKELQALVSDVLDNITNMDSTKIKDKIRMVQETLAQLAAEWNILKSNSTVKPTTIYPESITSGAIDDTRLGMASTIRDLLVKLSDLHSQISSSTIEANRKNAYLLAVSSGEKLVQLLQSILPKIELNLLFGRIFEVKDLIQDIVFDWNSNNPEPLTTTSSPNDPFADIKKSLHDLDSSLFSFKLDVLSFPGDPTLVEVFLKRNAGIQTAADQLRLDLIYIDIKKGAAQWDLLLSSFRKLREDFTLFLEEYRATSTTKAPTTNPPVSFLKNPGFTELGTYVPSDGTSLKTYWISKVYSQNWDKAKALCNSFEMQFVTLDSPDEATKFLQLCTKNADLFDETTHIGSLTTLANSNTEWFWMETEKRVNFPINWSFGQPNDVDGSQLCLALDKKQGSFYFNDLSCSGSNQTHKFICQSFEM